MSELKNFELKQYNNILKNIDFNLLNNNDKQAIFKELLKDKCIKDLKNKLLVEDTNINDLINQFLDTFKSKHTKKSYKAGLLKFLDYCQLKNIVPITATTKDIDFFSSYLFNNFSNGVARVSIAAVSSFFGKLFKWDILEKSPCIMIKRQAPKNLKDKKIPSVSELNLILDYFKEKNKLDLYYSILLTSKEGFRIGFLSDFKINKINDKYCYFGVSKNKTLQGSFKNINENDIKKISKIDFKTTSLQVLINRHLKKLVKQGIIKNVYSYHDFRHFYSVNQYIKNKDIYQLSKKLNHSNINTTTIYLQSLNID